MQWLEEDFLGYIDSWEHEVQDTGCPANEKRKMMLSSETIEGIRIKRFYSFIEYLGLLLYYCSFFQTFLVKSFVDMTRYLLSSLGVVTSSF